jgi:ankyrin repeat protein
VVRLLASGADVNVRGSRGMSPLHCAVLGGHFGIVIKLLRKRARVDAQDNFQQTPLHYSAYLGTMSIARQLLENRASPSDRDDYHRTPLHLAAIGAGKDTLQVLIPISDQQAKDRDGKRAVALAVSSENIEAMKLLLTEEDQARTALRQACIDGLDVIVSTVLEMEMTGVNIPDERGYTALHYAADNNHRSIVKLLIKNGADVEIKEGGYLRAAIHLAAIKGHEGVVRLLPNKEALDKDGHTPLAMAAEGGHEAVVRILLEAEVSVSGHHGKAPLHCAAYAGHLGTAQMLVSHGADINALDEYQQTALCGAARHGHEGVVQFLLGAGANAEIRDVNGQTPFMWACERGNVGCVKALLLHGVDTTAKDTTTHKMTGLHWAAMGGMHDTVRVLIEAGVDLGVKGALGEPAANGGEGMTALEMLKQGAEEKRIGPEEHKCIMLLERALDDGLSLDGPLPG